MSIFKLAVRLRMSGAFKNRDWWAFFFVVHLSLFRILKFLCYFGTYGIYTYGMYSVYIPMTNFLKKILTKFLTQFLTNFLTNFLIKKSVPKYTQCQDLPKNFLLDLKYLLLLIGYYSQTRESIIFFSAGHERLNAAILLFLLTGVKT